MVSFHLTGDPLWERMGRAVDKVRQRLERATRTLERAGIPYTVSGDNAVRVWVAQVDEAAVRTTRDVDILLRREDLPAAIEVLEAEGFVHRHSAGIDMFLDGPGAKAREAVHIVFAGEKVREDYLLVAPEIDESWFSASFRVLTLEALVRMKLTSFRDRDRMHLRDMIDVGLIDESWRDRFSPEFGDRLQKLLDDPDG